MQQLHITDVTQNHVRDFELLMRMGDSLSMVNDNLRGLHDAGGRKTATEVRTSAEAGASRLASHTRLVSAQGMVDLTEQLSINIQQFMEDEFYISLVGSQGLSRPLTVPVDESGGMQVSPEMLVGDFYYPIHDGTLPIDRVAMVDVWKQIFMAIAGDQQLRGQFDLVKIFEFLAELGGASNIDRFKVNLQTSPAPAEVPGAIPAPQPTPGIPTNPGARMAGAL